MEEESPWSNLGPPLGTGIAELTDRIQKLESLIHAIQRDFITSIEAIQRRLNRVEDGKPLESIFDVMTQEEVKRELGVEIGIRDEDVEDDEVYVVESGFTVPPPSHREVEVDMGVLDIPEIEEVEEVPRASLLQKTIEVVGEDGLSIEEEFTAINEVAEPVDGEHPDLLDEESEAPVDWGDDPVSSSVERILGHIGEHGGVVNQYLKRWDLIPQEADKALRSSVVEALKEAGVQTLKVNRTRHFYTMEGDDAEARYAALYG